MEKEPGPKKEKNIERQDPASRCHAEPQVGYVFLAHRQEDREGERQSHGRQGDRRDEFTGESDQGRGPVFRRHRTRHPVLHLQ